MIDDLIKRLQRADEYEPLGHDGWEAATALTAADATIARLEAENARLRNVAGALADRVEGLRRMNEIGSWREIRDVYAAIGANTPKTEPQE